ncbi:unnamed protein product [Calicophoron daubneyi]|uniref:RRM domain-containing protein n=1 Tax=Calicophoron daubneyi TaxID=300641 RepID=A0AAV2TYI4_CALDB
MRRPSRSPADEGFLSGKIIIGNLPRRPVSHSDVHSWLKKYGNISEIVVYKDCLVVQFDTDLEAAGAVQCENGARFFDSVVSVKHAEPSVLDSLRHSGPPVDRFTSGSRRYRPDSRDKDRGRDAERDRERESERDRDRLRDRDRGRRRDRDDSPRGRYGSASYDRRHRHGDASPRRRSRSPPSPRPGRRHVHPLSWLSEVAEKNSTRSSDKVEPAVPTRTPPPYTIAIVAVQHDLVPYAEIIEKRVSTEICVPEGHDPSALRTHIVVLLSADHLTPCLADLTRDRVPFAVICTNTNWTHGSCTVRILYVPTQQEHRNMPLDDALLLLKREFDTYLSSENVPAVSVATEDVGDRDDTFLAPNRNLVTLLRMLADSRILSIGELDEIATFVQERKRRLEGRRMEGMPTDTRNGNTTDLKSRILNMLYPQPPVSSATVNNQGASGVPPPNTTPVLPPPNMGANLQAPGGLAAGMQNPTVQQAIDTLMMMPADRFPQPVPPTAMIPQNPVGNTGSYQKAPVISNNVGGRMPYGGAGNRYSQNESGKNLPPNRMGSSGGPASERPKYDTEQPQKGQAYLPPSDRSQARNSAYKQPYGDGPRAQPMHAQSGTYKKEIDDYRQGATSGTNRGPSAVSGPGGGRNDIRGHESGAPIQTVERHGSEPSGAGWPRSRKGKRGGVSRNGQPDPSRQSYTVGGKGSYDQAQRGPADLMSTDVVPVGSVAEAYRQEAYGYQPFYGGDGRTGPMPPGVDGRGGFYGQSTTGTPYPYGGPSGNYSYSGPQFY